MHWPLGKHCSAAYEEPAGKLEADQVRPLSLVTKPPTKVPEGLLATTEQVAAVEQERLTGPKKSCPSGTTTRANLEPGGSPTFSRHRRFP